MGEHELDRLLNAGLASYSDCEPLDGIEGRVLRRVHSVERSRRWWWIAASVPVMAALLVLLIERPAVEPLPVAAPPKVAAAELSVASPERVAVRQRPARRPARAHVERPSVFPTPTPLTGEERRLIELAALAPEALGVEPVTAIEIEPIRIKPLDTGGTN